MNNMSAQPDPVRQNIIDWCNEDNIDCVESTTNQNMAWNLMINTGRVAVFRPTRFSDRIYFQSGINIAPQHQTLIANNGDIRNKILLQIPSLIIQLDHDPRVFQTDTTITRLNITKIHFHTTISKAMLLSMSNRLLNVHQLVLNQLSVPLQTTMAQLEQTPTTPDASEVGIG